MVQSSPRPIATTPETRCSSPTVPPPLESVIRTTNSVAGAASAGADSSVASL